MPQIPENDTQKASRLSSELRKLVIRIEKLLGLIPADSHKNLFEKAEFIGLNARVLGLDGIEKHIVLLEDAVVQAEASVVSQRKTAQPKQPTTQLSPPPSLAPAKDNMIRKIIVSMLTLCVGSILSLVWNSSTPVKETGSSISISDFDPGIKFWIGIAVTAIMLVVVNWRKRPISSSTPNKQKLSPNVIIAIVGVSLVIAAILLWQLSPETIEILETPASKKDSKNVDTEEWWKSLPSIIIGTVVGLWLLWKVAPWNKIPKPHLTTSWVSWRSAKPIIKWVLGIGITIFTLYFLYGLADRGVEGFKTWANRPAPQQVTLKPKVTLETAFEKKTETLTLLPGEKKRVLVPKWWYMDWDIKDDVVLWVNGTRRIFDSASDRTPIDLGKFVDCVDFENPHKTKTIQVEVALYK